MSFIFIIFSEAPYLNLFSTFESPFFNHQIPFCHQTVNFSTSNFPLLQTKHSFFKNIVQYHYVYPLLVLIFLFAQ
ncbi:hypothetical protein IC582_021884 [Cucumis melo]